MNEHVNFIKTEPNMDMRILRTNLPVCICSKLMQTAQLCAEKKRYYVFQKKTRNLVHIVLVHQEG